MIYLKSKVITEEVIDVKIDNTNTKKLLMFSPDSLIIKTPVWTSSVNGGEN
jgi:hypothetical protein